MQKKGKRASVGVHMRLPAEVVARLDELVASTSGSRGDVVKLLVTQAQLEHVLQSATVVALPEVREAVTSD